MYKLIEELKQKEWLWQASRTRQTHHVRSSGFQRLDEQLGGGLPTQGVIELQSPPGIGELRLWVPSLVACNNHNEQERLIVFIRPPAMLNAEFLVSEQINLSQVLFIQAETAKEALWAAEQCLRSGACRDVFLWHDEELEIAQARRLEVASQTGDCRQILIRQPHNQHFSLPISLSMKLSSSAIGIDISIEKRKGSWSRKPFTIDMRPHWPELAIQPLEHQVIQFPSIQQRG